MKITNDFGNKLKGSVGEQVTASDWKGRNYLKAYSRPSNPSTPQQQEKRTWLAEGMTKWQSFDEYQKEAYLLHEKYFKEALSPLNSFLRVWLTYKKNGWVYTNPFVGNTWCRDSVTTILIPEVHYVMTQTGRTVPYKEIITPAAAVHRWAHPKEDQKYDIHYHHPDYHDNPRINITWDTAASHFRDLVLI